MIMIIYKYAFVVCYNYMDYVCLCWLVLHTSYVSFTAAGKSNQKLVRCLLSAANYIT